MAAGPIRPPPSEYDAEDNDGVMSSTSAASTVASTTTTRVSQFTVVPRNPLWDVVLESLPVYTAAEYLDSDDETDAKRAQPLTTDMSLAQDLSVQPTPSNNSNGDVGVGSQVIALPEDTIVFPPTGNDTTDLATNGDELPLDMSCVPLIIGDDSDEDEGIWRLKEAMRRQNNNRKEHPVIIQWSSSQCVTDEKQYVDVSSDMNVVSSIGVKRSHNSSE